MIAINPNQKYNCFSLNLTSVRQNKYKPKQMILLISYVSFDDFSSTFVFINMILQMDVSKNRLM